MQSLCWVVHETRESKKNKKHNPTCKGCQVESIIHRHIMPALDIPYEKNFQVKFTKLMETKLHPMFPTNLEFWIPSLVMSYMDHSEMHTMVMNNIVDEKKSVENICTEILQVYVPGKKAANWNSLIGGYKCTLINSGMEAHYGRKVIPMNDHMDNMDMLMQDTMVHQIRCG